MNQKLATVISRVFEPAILLAGAFVACAVRLGVPLSWSIFWLTIMLGPMLVYRMWLKRRQHLDWDIKDRKKRVKPLSMLVGFLGIISMLIWFVEPRLFPLLALFVVWVIGFLGFTTWVTKISGHSGGTALATALIVYWFGWSWWPILLLVPLVSWARVATRDHTVPQVVAGAAYSWILLVILDNWIIG